MQREHYHRAARAASAARAAREDLAAFALAGATPRMCEACLRRFLVVEASDGGLTHVCTVCGGALVKTTLAPGIYEIGGAERPLQRRVKKASAQAASSVPREADVGYNESHGYGPSHGGPTGPGDAPAAPVPPVKDVEEAKDDPGREGEEAPGAGANDKQGGAGE